MASSKLLVTFCATAVLLLLSETAFARSFRVTQVPNGSKFGCALCHNNAGGGGPRNGFGSQVENTLIGVGPAGQVDWSSIFDQDGDADGYPNGRELGDPDGTWEIGMANPSGDTYAPFDRADSPCGDGVMENPPEECDGDDMPADVACEDFDWGPGTLSCSSTCRINQEACEGYEIVIPNNTNPPANNTNPPSNNSTNNMTTSDPVMPVQEAEDEGGCATASGGRISAVWLLIAMVGLRRRRRSEPH